MCLVVGLQQMLCEERGSSFLEIADGILKGVMESRNDKIWAHFTIEANRDVTRMEIFMSLVSLLDQAAKNGGDCNGKANISVHEQSFNQPYECWTK
ncbi:putative transcription factor LHW [Helianthus anomalus]